MTSVERLRRTARHYWRRGLDWYLLPGRDGLYQFDLWTRGASLDPDPPAATPEFSQVLETRSQIRNATTELSQLGLHSHRLDSKNWDHLQALKNIYHQTNSDATILDAGGGRFSPLIEWLFLYGYRDLTVVNIDFDRSFGRGPIDYLSGDLTNTHFPDNHFDAISSMSVIEHGVPLDDAFAEFKRLLKPNGVLTLSTDYWPEKRRTTGKETNYGESTQMWEIFSDNEMKELLSIAADNGFETREWSPSEPEEPVISFNGMDYTFAYLMLSLK